MNQLLKTIDVTQGRGGSATNILNTIESQIHIIGIESDLFFVSDENRETLKLLQPKLSQVSYHEISSIHGHDAFLMEYDQLNTIVSTIFQNQLEKAV